MIITKRISVCKVIKSYKIIFKPYQGLNYFFVICLDTRGGGWEVVKMSGGYKPN